MYAIDGDFGKVRLIRYPLGESSISVPFCIESGGWHKCNEKYRVEHKQGLQSYSLYFSITDGGIMHINQQKAFPLPAGSVILVPPGCRHSYYTEHNQIWEFYWLYLSQKTAVDFSEIFDEQNNFILQLSNMESISSEFQKLLGDRNWSISEFLIESSRITSNIYHLLLLEKEKELSKSRRTDLLIIDMIKEMEQVYAQPIQLTDLSQKYYISVPQLIRRFKKETGMSPHEYLTVIRLRKAEEFLRYSGMTVEEISRKTGFASTSNFITQFRKKQNLTPGQYRKEIL